MTEFFIVPYPEGRTVFVDGGPNGRTNRVQSVERGSHTFDLGFPADYMPDALFTFVGDTTLEDPQVITFVPVAAATVATTGAAPAPARKKAAKKSAKKKSAKKKRGKRKTKAKTRRAKHR